MPNLYPGPLPDDPEEDEDYLPVRPANSMANLDSLSGVAPVNTGAPLIRSGASPVTPQPPAMPGSDYPPVSVQPNRGAPLIRASGAAMPQPPAMPDSEHAPVSIPRGPSGPNLSNDIMSGNVAPPVYNEPKVSTGRAIGGGLLSLISPQLGQRVMEAPVQRAQREYGAEKNQYDAAINQGKDQSEASLQGAQANEANARADALKNPQQKPIKGALVFDKAGNAVGYQNEDGDLMAPDNPKLPPDVAKILGAAKPKPAPGETNEQNKLAFQTAASKIAAEGLPTDPTHLPDSIKKSKTLTPEEKSAMRGYMATNPNPATQVQVSVAGAENRAGAANKGRYYSYSDEQGNTHLVTGDKLPDGVDAVPIKDPDALVGEARTANIIQKSLNQVSQDVHDHPEIFDNAAARNILATATEQLDRASAGMLIAGTGGSLPLPSGLGDMINTALENKGLDKKTGEALRQYIADYKSMKDKTLTMQMEMQNGKMGRASAQGFKAIADQIPNGATPDSKTAQRQIQNLQQTQSELMKKYPDKYGDYSKEKPFQIPSESGNVPPAGARVRDYTQIH